MQAGTLATPEKRLSVPLEDSDGESEVQPCKVS